MNNTPEVFGLHSNAEIGYYTKSARDMWMQLIELQPQTSDSGAGMSREEFIDATATDILKKLPVVYDLDKLKKKYGLEVTPTQIVLLQELERFNHLISTINKSLSTLKKVIFNLN